MVAMRGAARAGVVGASFDTGYQIWVTTARGRTSGSVRENVSVDWSSAYGPGSPGSGTTLWYGKMGGDAIKAASAATTANERKAPSMRPRIPCSHQHDSGDTVARTGGGDVAPPLTPALLRRECGPGARAAFKQCWRGKA